MRLYFARSSPLFRIIAWMYFIAPSRADFMSENSSMRVSNEKTPLAPSEQNSATSRASVTRGVCLKFFMLFCLLADL
jgi:hypothetical protein